MFIVIIGFSSGNKNEMYGSGYIVVNEQTWSESPTTSYLCTVPESKIGSASNRAFGREVYFLLRFTPMNLMLVHSLIRRREIA